MVRNADHPASLDAFGEMVVLDHIADLQLFVIDRVVLAYELECCLMVKVLPLATHFLMRFRKQRHRLAPAIAPSLAASSPAAGQS